MGYGWGQVLPRALFAVIAEFRNAASEYRRARGKT